LTQQCFQSLDLHHGQQLLGAPAALGAGLGVADGSPAPAALCWEPSAAELRQLRRRVAPGGRVVVAGRPWRYQDWPMPKGKLVKDEMEMCGWVSYLGGMSYIIYILYSYEIF
jgi:hypothetical protein